MSTATSESVFTSTKENLENKKATALQYKQKATATQDAILQKNYKHGALQALSTRKKAKDTFTNIYKNLALTKAIETCPCYSSAKKQIVEIIKDKKNKNEWTEQAKEQTKNILNDICKCYYAGEKAMEDYIKKSEELIAQHTTQKAGKTRKGKSKSQKKSRRMKRRTKQKK